MRTCPDCGTANGDADDFCGNCGAYVGWSQDQPKEQERERPRAGEEETPRLQFPPQPEAVPEIPTRFSPELPGGLASELPAGLPTDLPADLPAAGLPPEGPADSTTGTPAPTPRPTPQPEEPPVGAVKPAKPIAQRPKVRSSTTQGQQVGSPCPSCGTPNAPARRFCGRCAAPLRPTAREVPLPWWRTVWPFRRRVRAGSGQLVRRLVITLVLLGLVVGGYFLIPAGRWLYEDVRDKLSKATPITPTSTTASASVSQHEATLATDGLSNTYWGAPKVGDSLTFTFRSPFRLVDVVVHTGVSKKAEAFRDQARPIRADLLITAADGTTKTKTITLADKPGPQTIQTGYSDVVVLQLVIRDAAGQSQGRHVALAEVEFFKRS